VHLRARDYHPALGVFTALDPFEGVVDRPMSLNGYSWVEGNVPNMTDASGKAVEREKIVAGATSFSCRCGWIDWTHAGPIHALNLIRTVKNALNPQIYTDSNCKGVVFQTRLGTFTGYHMAVGGVELYGRPLFGNYLPWYFIPRNAGMSWQGISAQIFSDLVQEFERQEAASFNPVARTSGQSIEDLPSYAIGFYIAQRLEESGMADGYYQAVDKLAYIRDVIVNLDFMQQCEPIMDIELNKRIYDEIEPEQYRTGTNDRFVPVDRAPELDVLCQGIPRNASRIPLWLGLTSLLMHVYTDFRKPDGKQDCNDQAIQLPYPNDPNNPADKDLPDSLLLYKCGGC
jgi:hypothetical protein